jgi:hypothetical protein
MLSLLSETSRKDAIEAFGRSQEEYCDGQFVAASGEMLCFFDGSSAVVVSPVGLRWTPQRPYQVNKWTMHGPSVWMPAAKVGRYQLFLRSSDHGPFVFLGQGRLSTHSHGADPWAQFQLEQKLPKEVWVRFGGYEGWLIRGDYSGRLTANEVDRFDAILRGGHQPYLQIAMNRYEGDELTLSTNAERGVLTYKGRRATGELSRADVPEVFRSTQRPMDFYVPADCTLPKEQAISAAREFFVLGQFPKWLVWEAQEGTDDDWLFAEIITSLRYLFGYSQKEATTLLHDYLSIRKQWQTAQGAAFHDDEMLHHEGPESMAYIIQWTVGLGETPGSIAFLDWRKSDYERRRLRD